MLNFLKDILLSPYTYAVIFLLSVAVILLFSVAYRIGKKGLQITTLEEGTITAFVKGESFWKFEARIKDDGDHYLVNNDHKIIPSTEDPRTYLEHLTGFYWVSILYPIRRRHTLTINARSLTHNADDVANLEHALESYEKPIQSLRWRFPRPILIKNVELSDNFKIDLIVFATFEVVNPYLPFFVYQGDFFDLLDAAVESAVIDFCNNYSYVEFQKLDKGKQGSIVEKDTRVSEERATVETLTKTPTETSASGSTRGAFTSRLLQINNVGDIENAPNGIVEAVGIKASDAFVFRYDLSEDDKEQAKAVQAAETKRLIAEGVREEAKGKSDAIREVARGERRRILSTVGALKKLGVNSDLAGNIIGEIMTAEKVGGPDSSITTWVSGKKPPVSILADGGE